jgi:hypothetical protein
MVLAIYMCTSMNAKHKYVFPFRLVFYNDFLEDSNQNQLVERNIGPALHLCMCCIFAFSIP